MKLTAIICTHNPRQDYLRRTIEGLKAQTLPPSDWELIIVDNNSREPVQKQLRLDWHPVARVVSEPELGLSAARRTGFAGARGEYQVLIDDDNVLASDYFAQTRAIFEANPRLGAIGGKSVPEFETPPPSWAQEFIGLLAIRDLGDAAMISNGLHSSHSGRNEYPLFAPFGAGMALRREAVAAWVAEATKGIALSDRRGPSLSSSGDNDIVLSLMGAGWEVGYFPQLSLQHLIPHARLQPAYLARLNRSIQQSWQQVLTRHDANPWPLLTTSGATIRKMKAWFSCRAWTSPAARIRWQGACGHFDGRVAPDSRAPGSKRSRPR